MFFFLLDFKGQTIGRAFVHESSGQQFAIDVNNWLVIKTRKNCERQASF